MTRAEILKEFFKKTVLTVVCPSDNLPSADSVKRRIGLSIRLMRICEGA